MIKEELIEVTSALKAENHMVTRVHYVGDLLDPQFPLLSAAMLTELIQQSVATRTWRANGGQGTIVFDPRTGALVIRQSAEMQLMLANSLKR